MKRIAAAAVLAGGLLLGATGCDTGKTAEPAPSTTSTQTFTECATEAFEHLKKERGVQYLIDEKHEANELVLQLCTGLPK